MLKKIKNKLTVSRLEKILPHIEKNIERVPLSVINERLNLPDSLAVPKTFLDTALAQFKMEIHDSILLKYLYKNLNPQRHLEIGTWKGYGTVLCLENCDATVWTVNLWEGEKSHAEWVYHEAFQKRQDFSNEKNTKHRDGVFFHQTDSYELIGLEYKKKSLGHRVCQIYSDSKKWDTKNYPEGFFDTCLIDGAHDKDSVISDTKKCLPLVKSGGVIVWHDFCLDMGVLESCTSPRGVIEAIHHLIEKGLKNDFQHLFWAYPSWCLVGVKK